MIKLTELIPTYSRHKIYCDLDTVLSDFDTAFREIADVKTKTGWEYRDRFGEPKVWEIIRKAGLSFWADMPWMPDGQKLWDYIKNYNPTILSAPAKEDIETCKTGKIIWCKRNLGPNVQVILEKQKYKYAAENHILIDDLEKNTIPWEQHGGISILHTSTDDTIKRLKELGL
jgi:hypothetical protein